MTELCPKCGGTPVSGCNGLGYIRVDEYTVRPCRNIYIQQLRNHLGKEIVRVQHVESSPLFELGAKGEPPKVDLTGQNLVLEGCKWGGLLPHLKWALGCKGLSFRFKIVTDAEVLNVKLGLKSRHAKGLSSAESADVFNSLDELVPDDCELLILRVGCLGHKNRAAAGFLLELLYLRESQCQATWIVQVPNKLWTISNSDELQQYLRERFKRLSVPPADPGESYIDPDDDNGMVEEDAPIRPTPNPGSVESTYRKPDPLPYGDLDFDVSLPGERNPKKGWRR